MTDNAYVFTETQRRKEKLRHARAYVDEKDTNLQALFSIAESTETLIERELAARVLRDERFTPDNIVLLTPPPEKKK